jgi:hypothetical protein
MMYDMKMINQCTQIFLKFDWMTFNFPDSKLEVHAPEPVSLSCFIHMQVCVQCSMRSKLY